MLINKKSIFFILFAFIFVLYSEIAYSATADIGIVAKVVNEFNTQSSQWFNKFKDFALNLFYFVAFFEVAYLGIMAALGRNDIAETFKTFILFVFTAAFFLAVINNYQEWTANIINGLLTLAKSAVSTTVQIDNPMMVGLELFNMIWTKTEGLSWYDIGNLLMFMFAGLLVLLCFTLLTAKVIVIKCEAIIAVTASLILIPLGVSAFFREYAINAMKYIFSVAFKLFAIQLVMGVGITYIQTVKGYDLNIDNAMVVVAFSIVLLAVAWNIPDIASGIIQGAHVGSGAGLGTAIKTSAVSAIGAGAIVGGGIAGAVKGGLALQRATSLARDSGAKGFFGTATGTGKQLLSNKHEANMNRTSMSTQIKENYNKMKTTNKINNQ